LFGENDDGAAFGSFVGEGGKLSGVGEMRFFDAGRGKEMCGGAIAERDGAGLVKEKNVDVTGGFHSASGHSENVAAEKPIHARDANGGEKAADGGGNQADQERDEYEEILRCGGIDRERLKSNDREQEKNSEAGEKNVECNFVGSFLAFGAFDE